MVTYWPIKICRNIFVILLNILKFFRWDDLFSCSLWVYVFALYIKTVNLQQIIFLIFLILIEIGCFLKMLASSNVGLVEWIPKILTEIRGRFFKNSSCGLAMAVCKSLGARINSQINSVHSCTQAFANSNYNPQLFLCKKSASEAISLTVAYYNLRY